MGLSVDPDNGNSDAFEVPEENWDGVCAFLDCQTQWRVTTNLTGVEWLGLDYTGVDVVMRRKGLKDKVFGDVQVMEWAALEVFGEKQ